MESPLRNYVRVISQLFPSVLMVKAFCMQDIERKYQNMHAFSIVLRPKQFRAFMYLYSVNS